MWTWFLIIGLALITFINRYLFFSRLIRYQPGARLNRFLSFSGQAVLTAIWLPIIVSYDSSAGLLFAGSEYLIATALVLFLAVIKVKPLFVIVIGIAVFALLRFTLI